jgi:thioredoxin reductase (NADPH)
LQDKAAEMDDVDVVTNHAVQELVVKDGRLAAVKVKDRATGEAKEWHPDGVFVFIGLSPNSEFLPETIKRDRLGFLVTDASLQTSVKGCFAAGDVRAKSTKQVASAAGEGATVALMIREYLKGVEAREPSDLGAAHLMRAQGLPGTTPDQPRAPTAS